jgi:hypothetical protein
MAPRDSQGWLDTWARPWPGSTARLLLTLTSMVDLRSGGRRLLEGPPRRRDPGTTESGGVGPPPKR